MEFQKVFLEENSSLFSAPENIIIRNNRTLDYHQMWSLSFMQIIVRNNERKDGRLEDTLWKKEVMSESHSLHITSHFNLFSESISYFFEASCMMIPKVLVIHNNIWLKGRSKCDSDDVDDVLVPSHLSFSFSTYLNMLKLVLFSFFFLWASPPLLFFFLSFHLPLSSSLMIIGSSKNTSFSSRAKVEK